MACNVSTIVKVLVATTAILVGLIAHNPLLVFKIPHVGFIFHAVSGGTMPPYFGNDMFHDEKNDWLRPDDVVVSVGAKSGTTWMLYCGHQIRSKGDDAKFPFHDLMYNTPWMEMTQQPGETWEERRSFYEDESTLVFDPNSEEEEPTINLKNAWDNPEYPFRIFKSHYTPETFGKDLIGGPGAKKRGVKFLAMARNGLDQIASAAPFFDRHNQGFRDMWGGFPPADGGSGDAKKDAILKERFDQMMPDGMFGSWYFGYINEWWGYKDEPNVLLLHYSDAKRDLPGTVSKLASFYGVELTEEEKDTVVEKCSFEYMKANTHLFNYHLPMVDKGRDLEIMTNGSMTRKAQVGEGKTVFPWEAKAIWAAAEEKEFGDDPVKLKWARSGGSW